MLEEEHREGPPAGSASGGAAGSAGESWKGRGGGRDKRPGHPLLNGVHRGGEAGGEPGSSQAAQDAWPWHGSGRESQAWKRHRVWTTVLVNLSAIMERTDEQLLPAVYSFVSASFNATPTQLGYLTQSRALVQALASPFGGLAGYYLNRVWVIAAGCTLWGAMTALFACSTRLTQGYALWAINGIGLSLVIPTGQSLTADYFSEAARGRAFGALYLTGAVGAMLGSIYATNIGHLTLLGLEGWRFAFLSVAAVSAGIGAANAAFARDPRCRRRLQLRQAQGPGVDSSKLARELRDMCLMPTFLLIILQGIVGSTPWNALVFLTLYLQTGGMSDAAAAALVSVFLGGTALGGLLGGWLGDAAARRFPDGGRIAVCQFSVLVGVPLAFLLFKGLPLDGGWAAVSLHACLLLTTGLLISWAAPACNNPIFSEIVPPHLRTVIYAFDRSFESAIAASAAPLVGLLAERLFGWKEGGSPDASAGRDLGNARALGNAMLVCTVVPWGLCGLFYSGLYWTYPRDRAKAAAEARQLHEAAPQEAIHTDSEGSCKSEGEPPEEGEHLRLLGGRLPLSDSSLELAALSEAEMGSGEGGPPDAEGAALLPGLRPEGPELERGR